MTYEEIMNISDIQEKQDKLKEFYTNEIGVEEWLIEKSIDQKIRFKDRCEYKQHGKYHRLTGPAIEFHNGTRGFYYIEGESMDETVWKTKATFLLREKKLTRAVKDEHVR